MVENGQEGIWEPGYFEARRQIRAMGQRSKSRAPKSETVKRFRFKTKKDCATLARFIRTHPQAKLTRWAVYRCLETGDAVAVMERAEWLCKGVPGMVLIGLYDHQVQASDLVEELE
jgi:hypothetical protein